MAILNHREYNEVLSMLRHASAAGDTTELARWADKHGPGLMAELGIAWGVAPDPKALRAKPEEAPVRSKVASAARGELKEAAFRVGIEKFAKGVHGPLVNLVARWVTREAGGDRAFFTKLHKVLSSRMGVGLVAALLSAGLLPFSKSDAEGNPENTAAVVARELRVFAAQRTLSEGTDMAFEALSSAVPMLLGALSSAEDPERALEDATRSFQRVRAVVDSIPLPEEDEAPAKPRRASRN